MTARLEQISRENAKAGTSTKFSSYLPEVYAGAPNRIERYVTYDQCDLDSEINRSLDTISEFCTQNQDDDSTVPFRILYRGEVTETETELLKDALQQWCNINRWHKRIFKVFRNTIKYGDQFFIRDPETYELLWVDAAKVEKIIVNEAKGKEIEQYVIRDLDFNLESLVATNPLVRDQYSFPGGYPRSANPASGAGNINYGQPTTPGGRTSRFYNPANSLAVDANHVVHLSLSEGMDQYWPFGVSILEAVYKTYKQKDLLEDCILIYRIVRAPERRVFYIDVGQLQGQRAMAYVERVKNEIYQRRIPNRTGGGTCLVLDTKIPLLDGRTLPLTDIIKEFEQGKKLWVYSVDPESGEICPGPVTWAGVTRKNTQVIRLTLDNGQTITCTPDHKIPIVNRGKIEAKDIQVGHDSLFSFNTRLYSINENQNNNNDPQYQQVFDHKTKKWQFTHRMVAKYLKGTDLCGETVFDSKNADRPKRVIHHNDWNKWNNNPENLTFMNHFDHLELHAKGYRDWYASLTDDKKNELKQKNREGGKAARARDPSIITRSVEAAKKTRALDPMYGVKKSASSRNMWATIKADADRYALMQQKKSQSRKLYIQEHPDAKFRNQGITIDQTMMDFCAAAVQNVGPNSKHVVAWLNNNHDAIKHYQEINKPRPGYVVKIRFDQFSRSSLTLMVQKAGFSTWGDFIKSLGYGIEKKTLSLKWDHRQISILADILISNPEIRKSQAAGLLNQNHEFVSLMGKLNAQTKGRSSKSQIADNAIDIMLRSFGYQNWSDFKNKVKQFNHKVVRIEWLDELTDTGTITVDGQEKYHKHHTFAVDSGIFVYNSVLDTAYNPISITEDFFLATNTEQRGTKIESLAGGEQLTSIDDLRYFNNKLMRGLGIPSSYLPTGPDDGTAVYNDGKVGTAFIQEYRFNKYCQRLQTALAESLDNEFKLFLKHRGIEVHSSLFELVFNPPQSFSEYRMMALDAERANLFNQVMTGDAVKYVSKRYALERYLGWSPDEILENEKQWKEENSNRVKTRTGMAPAEDSAVSLGSVGVKPPMPEELGGLEAEPEIPEIPEIPGAEAPTAPETTAATPTETP